MNLREANDDKYKLHVEKEKIEIAFSKEVTALKSQIEELREMHKR